MTAARMTPPPDPAELHNGLVQTLTNSAETADRLPTEWFTQGHKFTGELSAALKMTSVAAQILLGLEQAANGSEASRDFGARIARTALRQFATDPYLRHLVNDCHGTHT